MNFTTGYELLKFCDENNISISEAMKQRELSLFEEQDIMKPMGDRWQIMKQAVLSSLEKEHTSMGGLIGGEAIKINRLRERGNSVCGTIISKALAYGMGVLEVNSSMGLIVAAPTAGSSGVIPGVFKAVQEEFNFSDEEMTNALFHAGAIGYLVSRNATVSGAEGGCQAEVGTASAMAASALTELMGGSPIQCLNAASSALTNVLGMVCDPIKGLVEAPCQKRNGLGISNAFICSEMSLSGIGEIVPFDEVVEAMYHVGKSLPEELRETALGGIAVTKSACMLCHK